MRADAFAEKLESGLLSVSVLSFHPKCGSLGRKKIRFGSSRTSLDLRCDIVSSITLHGIDDGAFMVIVKR